jgi:hypothetical protein
LIRAIIYGTDANDFGGKIKLETPSRFKIVGFVDKTAKRVKRMLDLPILVLKKKLPTLMRLVLKVLL